MDFEILLVSSSNERIALNFASNLERLGIGARVRTVDSAQYQNRVEEYDFDMVFKRWGVSLSPGNEQTYYWGSKEGREPGSRNLAGVADPVVDALIAKAVAAPDRQGLVTAIQAMDRVLLWGHYFIPLYYKDNDSFAYWDKFGLPPATSIYGNIIEAWWAK